VDAASGERSALSAFNADRVATIDWLPLEEFWFRDSKGQRLHSMLALPPGFDPQKKYPLFVLIHGGPHGMMGDSFGTRWNYHLLARPGYVVLFTNYSGSTGYGEAFSQRIDGDTLRGPAREINEAADEAIRRYPFIDGSRQAAGGASYGGHLANWLAVTTDRYKALVSHAGMFDQKAQWTTSDSVYGRELRMGGPPWEKPRIWKSDSPFTYATRLKTPMLVTFGEKDYRVPVNNGLELWTLLKRQDVEARFVVFPGENHWILGGENSRFFYQQVHDWLGRYLQP
jgi:dipeptidyl aminopeptidase/acylaminoacyl peptidase